ncbi:MAG: lactonase family protein [Caldilineaceae bacterium]
MTEISTRKLRFYVGTYTRRGSEGIYRFEMDPSSGRLSGGELAAKTDNPSFLAIHPDLHTLYAVNEVGEFNGIDGGAVTAYRIDAETGDLTFLNQQPTHGAAPCYVSVDATGQAVLVANYSGGNVAVYKVAADGSLSAPTDRVQHTGSGPNPKRQEQAHAHSINVTPHNRCALVADLGMDKVMVYDLDPAQGKLTPHDPPFATTPAGAGPRHFDFHPDGRTFYVINEMGSSVSVYTYDADAVRFAPIQTISTLPAGWEGNSTCADIHISPSGRFVYGSNRGHDSIAIFAVDEVNGSLTSMGHTPTGGRTPRNFAIDPTGTFLLAANQDSDSIVVFAIDRATGALEPAGIEVSVPMPVCVAFYPQAV